MSIDPYQPTEDQNPHSPMPGKPDPLSPGRVDLDPEHEPGIDELPDNDGQLPPKEDRGDIERVVGDPDHAERDGVPNPR